MMPTLRPTSQGFGTGAEACIGVGISYDVLTWIGGKDSHQPRPLLDGQHHFRHYLHHASRKPPRDPSPAYFRMRRTW